LIQSAVGNEELIQRDSALLFLLALGLLFLLLELRCQERFVLFTDDGGAFVEFLGNHHLSGLDLQIGLHLPALGQKFRIAHTLVFFLDGRRSIENLRSDISCGFGSSDGWGLKLLLSILRASECIAAVATLLKLLAASSSALVSVVITSTVFLFHFNLDLPVVSLMTSAAATSATTAAATL